MCLPVFMICRMAAEAYFAMSLPVSLTTDWLAQLVELWNSVQKVVGLNPDLTYTQGVLK